MRRFSNTMILVLAMALGLLGGLGWSFSDFVYRIAEIERLPPRHAEGAVALTGGADRIADAVELLAGGNADRLLITGVNRATTRNEIARHAPVARTLFDCCVDLGYAASNTIGNAAETERWARAHHIRSLIVVTSNYHMPRAMAEIGSALPGVDLIAYPVVTERSRSRPWWSDGPSLRLIMWEYCKYVLATIRLQVAPGNPAPIEQAGDAVRRS